MIVIFERVVHLPPIAPPARATGQSVYLWSGSARCFICFGDFALKGGLEEGGRSFFAWILSKCSLFLLVSTKSATPALRREKYLFYSLTIRYIYSLI